MKVLENTALASSVATATTGMVAAGMTSTVTTVSSGAVAAGGALGAAVGALGGPVGAIVGGSVGGWIGSGFTTTVVASTAPAWAVPVAAVGATVAVGIVGKKVYDRMKKKDE